MVSIRDAMRDDRLFGSTFGTPSFAAWRALLSGFYGLELDATEVEVWKRVTGRAEPPTEPHSELWMAIGRRGGKSHAAALIAVFEAVFRDHRDRLAPGEMATCMVIAADRPQARAVMRFIAGLCDHPMIRPMIRRQTETTIEFSNRSVIEVATASFRSVRGYTASCVICDEVAFWYVDGARADSEIIAALRPALATLEGRLIAISSPYAKRGQLWENYAAHYGKPGKVLVAQAASRVMNPSLSEKIVADALRADPSRAAAEYLGEFRSDIASLIDPAVIESATRQKPLEMPPMKNVSYVAFVDPSGGGRDEYGLAIGHREGDRLVIDVVRGLTGSPAEITREYADLLKRYRVSRVSGDRYAGAWPRDEFLRFGVSYRLSELDRSGLYLEALAALNSGRVELPPCQTTLRQFAALERRTGRSGRDQIDHPPNGHDDRSNACAGLISVLASKRNIGWTGPKISFAY